jgi:Rha family phage regulatory protein
MRKTTVKPATSTTAVTTEVAPTLTVIDGKAIVTSLHIAQVFSKTHGHVLRDIEEVIKRCQAEFVKSNFGLSSYMSDQNKPLPMYNLTRDGFTLVAMGFNGAKAFEFKIAYINAFATMEKSLIELEGKGTGQSLNRNNSFKALANQDLDNWLKTDFGYCDEDLALMAVTVTTFSTRLDGVLAQDRATAFREGFVDNYYKILSRSRDKQKQMTPAHRLAFALNILSDFAYDQLLDVNQSLIKMGQKPV